VGRKKGNIQKRATGEEINSCDVKFIYQHPNDLNITQHTCW
jgi:hypothetical protein